MRIMLLVFAAAACSPTDQTEPAAASRDGTAAGGRQDMPLPPRVDGSATGTRPAGEPALATYVGTFARGTECPTLTLGDGRVFSLSVEQDAFAEGTTLEVVGELADASFCMAGEGAIIPDRIAARQ